MSKALMFLDGTIIHKSPLLPSHVKATYNGAVTVFEWEHRDIIKMQHEEFDFAMTNLEIAIRSLRNYNFSWYRDDNERVFKLTIYEMENGKR